MGCLSAYESGFNPLRPSIFFEVWTVTTVYKYPPSPHTTISQYSLLSSTCDFDSAQTDRYKHWHTLLDSPSKILAEGFTRSWYQLFWHLCCVSHVATLNETLSSTTVTQTPSTTILVRDRRRSNWLHGTQQRSNEYIVRVLIGAWIRKIVIGCTVKPLGWHNINVRSIVVLALRQTFWRVSPMEKFRSVPVFISAWVESKVAGGWRYPNQLVHDLNVSLFCEIYFCINIS